MIFEIIFGLIIIIGLIIVFGSIVISTSYSYNELLKDEESKYNKIN